MLERSDTERFLFGDGANFRSRKLSMSVLVIDNYDSFTYNLVQYLGELGQDVEVVRNDEITLAEISDRHPDQIVISPGPCTPNEAGISVDVIREFGAKIPMLGVCLGHQAIGSALGGHVVRASKLMHGKTSPVYHHGEGVFHGLPSPLDATRYHSLIIERETLPDSLTITAETDDGTIMGVRHKSWPLQGVQFHPESVLTDAGRQMLANFIAGE
jgi:anthranilate synthase/aminodeoxychorismate synthase-like glutamine amidotransferase